MKRIILLQIVFSLITIRIFADEVTTLKILQNNGNETLFILHERPEAVFKDDSLHITSTVISASFLLKDIYECNFIKNDTTQVETSINKVNSYQYQFIDNNKIMIKGMIENTIVRLYDIKGVCLTSLKTQDNSLVIDLTQYAAGTYILSVSKQPSIKFIKR